MLRFGPMLGTIPFLKPISSWGWVWGWLGLLGVCCLGGRQLAVLHCE